jgi:hypothetical protein
MLMILPSRINHIYNFKLLVKHITLPIRILQTKEPYDSFNYEALRDGQGVMTLCDKM